MPDPAVSAKRRAATRGVARVESRSDPIDRDDLAELAPGVAVATAHDTGPTPEPGPASESEAEPNRKRSPRPNRQ